MVRSVQCCPPRAGQGNNNKKKKGPVAPADWPKVWPLLQWENGCRVRASGTRMTVARLRKTGWGGSREGLGVLGSKSKKGDVARAQTRHSVCSFYFYTGAGTLLRREASPVTKKNICNFMH